MGKKVSSILYRISRFNNYKNIWVINYNKFLKNLLYEYILLHKVSSNLYLNLRIIFFNSIIKIYGKLYKNKISHNLHNNINLLYNYVNTIKINSIFINLYQLIYSIINIQFLKLFIRISLLKGFSIKHIYSQIYNLLLNNYSKNLLIFCGIRIIISGRLEGDELAHSEVFYFGTLILQQIDMFIEYENFNIITKYGLLGIKIWIGKFI